MYSTKQEEEQLLEKERYVVYVSQLWLENKGVMTYKTKYVFYLIRRLNYGLKHYKWRRGERNGK